MSPEKTEQLYSAFPGLYRGKDKIPQESLMYQGFECDDGWFDLIWKLSAGIENAARIEGLDPDGDGWPEATQVKQKFGALRFYIRNASDEIRTLIGEAVEASEKICEICGAPGSRDINNRRNVKTVCADHALDSPRQSEHGSMPVWKLLKD